MGAPRALALCYNFGGALDFQAGRWTSAEKSLRDAAWLYQDIGSASGESLSLQRLGLLLTARGEIEEARRVLDDGIVVAERAAMRSHCLTRLHASLIHNRLAAGDRAGIELSLGEGLPAAHRHGTCVTCNALLIPEIVRAEIELGRLEAAEASCARLQRIAAEFDSHVWTAMAARCQGWVLLARGRTHEAFDQLERARLAYLAAAQPYEAARCLEAQAACPGDPAEAERLQASAREMFTALGARAG